MIADIVPAVLCGVTVWGLLIVLTIRLQADRVIKEIQGEKARGEQTPDAK